MELELRKSFKIFAPGSSLQRRVAYSLAVVRLVLVPVIFMAVYYLFKMGSIVDRIVSLDAPVATLAEQTSVQMLDARRAERSYFLLRDPQYLQANRNAVTRLKEILEKIRSLAPTEQGRRRPSTGERGLIRAAIHRRSVTRREGHQCARQPDWRYLYCTELH